MIGIHYAINKIDISLVCWFLLQKKLTESCFCSVARRPFSAAKFCSHSVPNSGADSVPVSLVCDTAARQCVQQCGIRFWLSVSLFKFYSLFISFARYWKEKKKKIEKINRNRIDPLWGFDYQIFRKFQCFAAAVAKQIKHENLSVSLKTLQCVPFVKNNVNYKIYCRNTRLHRSTQTQCSTLISFGNIHQAYSELLNCQNALSAYLSADTFT